MLEGFELLGTVIGIPSVSITKNGVAFNKATLEKLSCPENVQALIDREGGRIAILPCKDDDREARSFYKPGRSKSYGVRWNNFDLRTTLESMMGWNLADAGWKAMGTYSEEDNALIFDLKAAERLNRG